MQAMHWTPGDAWRRRWRVGPLALAAVLLLASCDLGFGDDGITIVGSFIANDPDTVYMAGTPSPNYAGDGFDNSCFPFGMKIGDPVYIRDTQGKVLATGEITGTFHWENEPDMAVDRSNHACDVRIQVKGVPKRDAYDLSVGFFVYFHDIAWDSLYYNEDSKGNVDYVLPDLRAGS